MWPTVAVEVLARAVVTLVAAVARVAVVVCTLLFVVRCCVAPCRVVDPCTDGVSTDVSTTTTILSWLERLVHINPCHCNPAQAVDGLSITSSRRRTERYLGC